MIATATSPNASAGSIEQVTFKMTKSVIALLVIGLIAVTILTFIILRPGDDLSPEPQPKPQPTPQQKSHRVEIDAPEGTRVYSKVRGKQEKYLGNAPATVNVPIGAKIILRYKDKERVISANRVKRGKISEHFTPIEPVPTKTPIPFVLVSINAVPWAEVFIKPPGTNYFLEPDTKNFTRGAERTGENRNVTPIRGKMRVQVGTSIKLVYDGREKIFPYESWGARKLISHNFLGQ